MTMTRLFMVAFRMRHVSVPEMQIPAFGVGAGHTDCHVVSVRHNIESKIRIHWPRHLRKNRYITNLECYSGAALSNLPNPSSRVDVWGLYLTLPWQSYINGNTPLAYTPSNAGIILE